MTWFSKMSLNPQRRQGRKLLTNPQAMHAAVMASFPPGDETHSPSGRPLWRLDTHGIEHTLYVVSPQKPDMNHLVEQAGWETAPAQSLDYDRFLDSLQIGQEWQFRLRANPVKTIFTPGKRGKVVPHVTVAQQSVWLASKAADHGFRLGGIEEADPSLTRVTARQDQRFSRTDPIQQRPGKVALRQAQFDGILTVTDAEKLRSAMIHGVGRGKAYGCGLLTLRKA